MPRGGGRRGESSAEPEALHELGVRGRKTGAFLKDTGERDEHGMQPLDAIFSSPRSALTRGEESGSEDMEISSSAGPGPRTVLKNRRSFQNANDRSSSPTRNPSAEKAARRLNFSSKEGNKTAKTNGKHKAAAPNGLSRPGDDSESEELDDVMGASENGAANDAMAEESMLMVDSMRSNPPKSASKAARGKPAKAAPQTKPKAATRAPAREYSVELDAEEPEEEPEEEELEQEEEEEEFPSAKQKARTNKNLKRREEAPSSSQPSKKRGPPRKSIRQDSPEEAQEPSEEEQEEEEEEEEEEVSPRKKQRTTGPSKAEPSKSKSVNKGKAPARGGIVVPVSAASKAKAKVKPKAKAESQPKTKGRPGRKPKNSDAEDGDVGEKSFVELHRGPPMPKARGLVSMRKDLDDRITQTRSGRHSYRPVEYWRGEQVVREDEEQADMFAKDRFVLPSIKEVVRVPVEEFSSRAAPSRGKGRPKPKKPVVEEDYEAWELNPGTVEGEIVIWETEHEEHPPADDEPVQVTDERIALSAKAVQTSEIRDATFRFAKTLTMPFMGAGVVDLPPGGEKRPKNSRKMHMVFFVHTGKVMVTINEAQFRISAGGMWFVPRGNYYSITNDYDNPSRVFFCQACEISSAQYEASQMSIGAS
ncbi:hypothetical protein V8C35DRAFT_304608 [Trichoderma chlorosporum]